MQGKMRVGDRETKQRRQSEGIANETNKIKIAELEYY